MHAVKWYDCHVNRDCMISWPSTRGRRVSYRMEIVISVLLFYINSFKHSDTPKPDIFHV